MFSLDEIVWAKSSVAGEIFWPAKVIEPDTDLDVKQKKKPTVAYVNFLAENTYEAIKSESNIKDFNCVEKEVFLKKGRNKMQQERRLQFEAAVREAEKFMKRHVEMKNTQNKRYLQKTKESSSPRTSNSELSNGKNVLKSEVQSNLSKPEAKASPQAKTKCDLSTSSKDSNKMSNNNASTSLERNKMDDCERKLAGKRGRPGKKKKFNQVEKSKSNTQRSFNKATNETKLSKHVEDSHNIEDRCGQKRLVLRTKNANKFKNGEDLFGKAGLESKNGCTNASGVVSSETTRGLRSNSLNKDSTCKMTETSETVAGLSAIRTSSRTKAFRRMSISFQESNSSDSARKRTQENCSRSNKRTRFKNEIKARSPERLKRSGGKKNSRAVHANGNKDNQGQCLETTNEESDSSGNETILKRLRIEFENCETSENWETSEKDDSLVGKDIKRQRIENSFSNIRMVETEAPFSNDMSRNLNSSRRNTTVDFGQNTCGQSNENMAVAHRSAANEHSSKSLETSIKLFKSEGVMGDHNFNDSGIASDKVAEILSCDENENKFELNGESSDENDRENAVEGQEEDGISSDDESLPAAFSSSSDAKKIFRRGDVVWVKYWKYPFWPAQIGRAHQTSKTHFYVEFLPKSDLKCIKVQKKNIKPFTENRETFLFCKNQEMEASLRKEFEHAVDQALKILAERVLPKDDRLDQFEDGEMSDISSEDEPLSSEKVEQDKPVFEQNKPVCEQDKPVCEQGKPIGEQDKPVCEQYKPIGEQDNPVCEQDKPVCEQDESEEESGNDTGQVESDNQEFAGNNSSQRQMTKYYDILNELHHCKQRLLDIYHEKIPSWRNKAFKYGTVTDKNRLQLQPGFGLVEDPKTCEEIIKLLKSWYEEETKQNFVTVDYIWDVWLPEAMIYYLHIADKISVEKAEEKYLDIKNYVGKQEVEDIRFYLNNQTIDQETMRKTIERAEQKFGDAFSN